VSTGAKGQLLFQYAFDLLLEVVEPLALCFLKILEALIQDLFRAVDSLLQYGSQLGDEGVNLGFQVVEFRTDLHCDLSSGTL